ncbi:MAG: hypothetical protein ACE5OO_02650 [Candidatus Bathyarchaeia archaeon]
MKPCAECLQEHGKPLCTHLGCCILEGADPAGSTVVGAGGSVKAPSSPHASLG